MQSPFFRWKSILHFIWKFSPRVWRKSREAQNPRCLKSTVKFLHSGEFWELPSAEKLHLWRCWFPFSAGCSMLPEWQNYYQMVCCPWYYCAWPTKHFSLTWTQQRIYEILPRGSRPPKILTFWRPLKTNLGFNNTSAVPQADRLHAMKH